MYCYTSTWTALQTTRSGFTQKIFLLLKVGKFNWSVCSLVNTFSFFKKTEMIGKNCTNKTKEKFLHNFGYRISRNRNFGSLYERKRILLKRSWRVQFRKCRLEFSLEVGRHTEVLQTRILIRFTHYIRAPLRKCNIHIYFSGFHSNYVKGHRAIIPQRIYIHIYIYILFVFPRYLRVPLWNTIQIQTRSSVFHGYYVNECALPALVVRSPRWLRKCVCLDCLIRRATTDLLLNFSGKILLWVVVNKSGKFFTSLWQQEAF